MRKLFSVLMMAAALLVACSDDDNGKKGGGEEGETEVDGLVFEKDGVYYLGNGDKEFAPPKGDYELEASKTYILRGWVYIENGSSITIPAGTIIKGKSSDQTVVGSSLIIEPGGKIYAEGTSSKPIVFTSDKEPGKRKPGDWGGIIICGKAPNNQSNDMQIEGGPRTHHGGTDPDDDSGVFKYCRIEFAGYPFATDMEINGLTLGSVGRGTKISHVQVSYCNDDSFEWFGGTVDCSYLIAYHGWDDDFDTDNGFSGTLQYLLGVRHPKLGDQSVSNGFESDNWSSGTDIAPLTSAKFSNVTLVGPIGQDPAFYNVSGLGNYIDAGAMDPNNGSDVGQFQAGIQIRRGSNISVYNTVILGWPVGIMIDNDKGSRTQDMAAASPARFGNIYFGGYDDNSPVDYDNKNTGSYPILAADRNKAFGDWFNNMGTENLKDENDKVIEEYDDKTRVSFTHDFILNVASGTRYFTDVDDLMIRDPRSVTDGSFNINPSMNFGPVSGSPLIGNFSIPSDFDSEGAGFIGAFASDSEADDWTRGWANFDPQNTVY
ncbi:MAG: hypothetical protein LUE26_08060 [Alistipes sp.]|nr:hypothetical protein [Alistipes sp.]